MGWLRLFQNFSWIFSLVVILSSTGFFGGGTSLSGVLDLFDIKALFFFTAEAPLRPPLLPLPSFSLRALFFGHVPFLVGG